MKIKNIIALTAAKKLTKVKNPPTVEAVEGFNIGAMIHHFCIIIVS